MRVLVTGHEGFIGSVLVRILKARGHEVVGLDTGFFRSGILGVPPPEPDFRIRKDIRAVEVADLAGVEGIVHLAALSDDPTGELDPSLTNEINYRATVRLAEVAKEAGVRRLLFSSSTSVYGEAPPGTTVDEASPANPITAYAKSKLAAENDLRALANEVFVTTSFRSATAYGASPRIRFCTLVVHNLMGHALSSGRILIKSDGTPWRPLVHVKDIGEAFAAVLDAPAESVSGEILNVGRDDQNFQIREIAETVHRTIPSADLTFSPQSQVDLRSYRVAFGKLKQCLPNLRLEWELPDGCRDLLSFLKASGFTAELFEDRRFLRLNQLQYLLETGRVDHSLYWREAGE